MERLINGIYFKKITGAFALLDSLVRDETKFIFGYPGGAILPIYDELYSWKTRFIKAYLYDMSKSYTCCCGYARST